MLGAAKLVSAWGLAAALALASSGCTVKAPKDLPPSPQDIQVEVEANNAMAEVDPGPPDDPTPRPCPSFRPTRPATFPIRATRTIMATMAAMATAATSPLLRARSGRA